MGDLPLDRVQYEHPFYRTGIDFAGPINLKVGLPRSKTTTKGYLAIFVCMSTKAVHIEIVSDLSAEAFIAALNRFFARRGIAKHIFTDNGRNFVGTASEIKDVYQKLTSDEFQNTLKSAIKYDNIEWHFIPPRAPHFGGLWEAAVKHTKYYLIRIIGQHLLTFEEMSTITCKVEAILNSRPLIPESDDPNDCGVLTPGHFLVGRPLNAKPEEMITEFPDNYLKRWHLLKKLSQLFWRRFNTEYLHNLQQRSKCYRNKTPVQIGQLVILKEDNVPIQKWLVGRIVKVYLAPTI
jgi:hypothetical protein